jgi:hypothetical protein
VRKYPRIPHLAVGSGVTDDDVVLTADDLALLLSGPVVVEEKIDGANVSVRIGADGELVVASRGGPGARDRGGLLGRARAWAAGRTDELRALLDGGRILFGEWVLVPHSISYDALPAPFIGLDVAESDGRFLPVADRDEAFRRAGIVGPPRIAEGTFDLSGIDGLIGRSAFGSPRAEGVVVRADGPDRGAPRIAKRVDRAFVRADDRTLGRRGPGEASG